MTSTEFGCRGTVASWFFMSASVLLLAACGGGDGIAAAPPPAASPPPPPPPPVSANTAPVATILTDNATPDEGQPFMLDASSSTDPDNDNLTFMWTQTAGPQFEIEDPTSPVLSFTAPELTETVTVTFEVEVSDGELVNITSVDVQLTNIDLKPDDPLFGGISSVFTTDGTSPELFVDATFGNRSIAGDTNQDGEVRLFPIGLSAIGQLESSPDFSFLNTYASPIKVFSGEILRAVSAGSVTLVLLQENLNTLLFLSDLPPVQPPNQILTERIVTNIEAPCVFVDGIDATTNSSFLLASRSGGIFLGRFVIGSLPGSGGAGAVDVTLQTVDDSSREFCQLQPVSEPITGVPAGTIGGFIVPELQFAFLDFIAVNTQAMEVVRFTGTSDIATFQRSFQEQQTVPLNIDRSDNLDLVASAQLISGSAGVLGLALVFSDGEHNGEHHLLLVGLNPERQIVQRVLPLPRGIPNDVHVQMSLDRIAIIVTSSSSPEATIYRLENPSFSGTNDFFALDEPTFLELGLGVGSLKTNPDQSFGLLVAYPELGEIRVIDPN